MGIPSEVRSDSKSTPSRALRVFLCHSSGDKQAVRELHRRLRGEGVDPWLDEENLLPGQDWHQEITKAVRNSDVVIVCLSCGSINKSGYVQKEIKFALDVADEQPEGAIYIIPLKLDECDVPDRLSRWHWVNFFEEQGYERLLKSLRLRANSLGTVNSPLSTSPDPGRGHSPDPSREVTAEGLDSPAVRYSLAAIKELVDAALGYKELDDLCRDNFRFVYSQYKHGTSKETIISKLVKDARQDRKLNKLLSEIRKVNPDKYAEFESRLRVSDDQPQSGEPSGGVAPGGVTFPSISIDHNNHYWEELSKTPSSYPFDRTCQQYFRCTKNITGAELSFDITAMCGGHIPVLLTALGVELVSVAHIYYPGGTSAPPRAVKIKKEDLYILEMPDVLTKVRAYSGSLVGEVEPMNLRELVSTRLPDPVYLEANAPYRYGLLLDKYDERIPNHAILRFWAKTNLGEHRSHVIYVET